MPQIPLSRALLAAAFCAWLITLVALLARPAASLATASGLYGPQLRDGLAYRWSGDRVVLPIASYSGPTDMTLSLGPTRWAERSAPRLVLRSEAGELARLTAPDDLRHYRLLLPPGTSALTIESTVDRPPGREPRWLGFTLYGLRAQPSGLPLGVLSLAFALLPIYLVAALLLAWALRRGFGIPLLLFGLALALRTIQLGLTPPGWRVDELVSLVDAWSLARTGRDHLGNLLPLGAFEALGDWISPLLTYLELPFVALFGPQRLVGRLITATVGALAAPLGYGLARALGLGRAGGLVAGLAMALSPWQIFMSRIALPPALVPTCWTLCMLAGVLFIRRGDRRSALGLALAAGIGLYAYPTLKLAVPLLVALAVGLALLRKRGRRGEGEKGRRGEGALLSPSLPVSLSPGSLLLAGLLLALLWAPFAYITLFNPASATRLGQAALRAESWGAWVSGWWAGYRVYFWPDFYYRFGDGSSIRGVPGFGIELWATLPLLILGLASLIISIARSPTPNPQPLTSIFILGALLIAALPASLTTPSPHIYRAAPLAPLYALLVGYGAALVTRGQGAEETGRQGAEETGSRGDREPRRQGAEETGSRGDRFATSLLPDGESFPRPFSPASRSPSPLLPVSPSPPLRLRLAQGLLALALAGALLGQGAGWWRAYTEEYPALQAALNQDGLAEAVRRSVELAPQYDEIWVSYDSIDQPYLFVLAARPFPPAEAQRLIEVERRPGRFNAVTSLGPYRFVDTSGLPAELPTLAAVPGAAGGPGYVVQEWSADGRRILVVRGM